ncbi:hypothetical protein SNEBB_009447 [Seison nebaliae]|nr:hypothetical protein SNEBB_009447 [Seison nebaliae]
MFCVNFYNRKKQKIRCKLILLNNEEIEVNVRFGEKASVLYDAMYQHFSLNNYQCNMDYFALRYYTGNGEKYWLNSKRSIYSQAKILNLDNNTKSLFTQNANFSKNLFLNENDSYRNCCNNDNNNENNQQSNNSQLIFIMCFRFYPSEPSLIENELFYYFLYLQLRRDLVTGRLPQPDKVDSEKLLSLSFQAELGNYSSDSSDELFEKAMNFQFLPKSNSTIIKGAFLRYKKMEIRSSFEAEKMFVDICKDFRFYGVDGYRLSIENGKMTYLGLTHRALLLYTNDNLGGPTLNNGENNENNRIVYMWSSVVSIKQKDRRIFLQMKVTKNDIKNILLTTLNDVSENELKDNFILTPPLLKKLQLIFHYDQQNQLLTRSFTCHNFRHALELWRCCIAHKDYFMKSAGKCAAQAPIWRPVKRRFSEDKTTSDQQQRQSMNNINMSIERQENVCKHFANSKGLGASRDSRAPSIKQFVIDDDNNNLSGSEINYHQYHNTSATDCTSVTSNRRKKRSLDDSQQRRRRARKRRSKSPNISNRRASISSLDSRGSRSASKVLVPPEIVNRLERGLMNDEFEPIDVENMREKMKKGDIPLTEIETEGPILRLEFSHGNRRNSSQKQKRRSNGLSSNDLSEEGIYKVHVRRCPSNSSNNSIQFSNKNAANNDISLSSSTSNSRIQSYRVSKSQKLHLPSKHIELQQLNQVY